MRRLSFLLLTLCLAALHSPAKAAVMPGQAVVAKDGQALMQVTIGAAPSARVQAVAKVLATYLESISGAEFKVQAGDGKSGLAVGLPADFPALDLAGEFDAKVIERREEYKLQAHGAGVLLIGATDMAVEHAVWDFLYRFGYRQFFPGKNWEVVPSSKTLETAVNVKEQPDWYMRRIWWTYGTWDENKVRNAAWNSKNRATAGFDLNTGHAYGGIIAANKKEFAAHPEYYALVNGERKINEQAKFCISNPGLRKLVVDHELRAFEKNPTADSVSVDPSDGGNWCECAECAKMGSISDRVTILANEVAEAVNAKFAKEHGEKFVGFYAYNMHSPPPMVKVHPSVIVSAATAFTKGQGVNNIIDGWQKQGARMLGMREYYSIIHWDQDLPGQARAGNVRGLADGIVKFYEKGARFMSAESSDNWGPNGLGYYIASRVLWDTKEANRVEEIIEDFYERAFGPAKAPMREFYNLYTAGKAPLISDDLVGRMYRQLDAALKLSDDPAITARINDLLIYTRYVDLYADYTGATGAERQKFYEATIRHAYRTRNTQMLHSLAIYRTRFRDPSVKTPTEAMWQSPERDKKGNPVNPWKSSEPFTEPEFKTILATGIAGHALLAFEPKQFTEELVKVDALKFPDTPTGMPASRQSRGLRRYYTWIDTAPTTLKFKVTNGLIVKYRDRGNAKIRLYPAEEAEGLAVAEVAAPPDGETRDIELTTTHTGLHYVEMTDGMDSSKIEWPEGRPMTLQVSFGPRYDYDTQTLYFYVPKGTKFIGGYAADIAGKLVGPDGKDAFQFDPKAGYFQAAVPAGQDGKLWSYVGDWHKARLMFMTVPPYLARNARELMLPREVVEADAEK